MIKKIVPFLAIFIIFSCAAEAQSLNKAKLDIFFVALNAHNRSMGSIAISANGTLVYQTPSATLNITTRPKYPPPLTPVTVSAQSAKCLQR